MAVELKKAVEQLNFFKLELINREQSYNQMFNASPNVGVMNPLGANQRVNLSLFILLVDGNGGQRRQEVILEILR